MGEAFHQGGWGMYPTTIVGVVLVAMAIQFARDPDPRRLRLVKVLSLLALLTSTLGFVAGVIHSFIAAGDLPSNELGGTVVVGVGESLNNIGLGLCVLVLAWIMVAIGAARGTPGPTREDLTGAI